MLPKDFTKQEKVIAECLSDLGLRFMEQVVFGQYTVDLWVPELNMIVEADGPIGHLRKADAKRDMALMEWPHPTVDNVLHIKGTTYNVIMEEVCRALDNLDT